MFLYFFHIYIVRYCSAHAHGFINMVEHLHWTVKDQDFLLGWVGLGGTKCSRLKVSFLNATS